MFEKLARFFTGDAVKTYRIKAESDQTANCRLEFGYRMGQELRENIQEIARLAHASRLRDSVKESFEGMLCKIEALELPECSYPFYEMAGLAVGSGVDLLDILVLNFLEDEVWGQHAEKCSLVFFRTKTGILIGRNEDNNRNYAGKMSLIHAKLTEKSATDLEFITLNYPGLLCGDTLAVTSNGLAIALQSLSPVFETEPIDLPRGLVGRILLEAKSLKEIARILHDLKNSVKHGIHIFAYDVVNGSGESFEIFPGHLFVRTIHTGQRFFAHTNHYLENLGALSLDQIKSENSRFRLGFLEQLENLQNPAPQVVADILSNRPPISGLRSSSGYNICRSGEGVTTTLHSQVLFIEKNKNPVLWTSPGNPADYQFKDWQRQIVRFVTA